MSGLVYNEDNIFAKIIRGDMPCFKIFETDHSLAILDVFPSAPGHCLLLPKKTSAVTIMDMEGGIGFRDFYDFVVC
jgi:histidine triad (HIT) family protein